MSTNIIYSDEYLCLISQSDGIYIETLKMGCSFDHFNSILLSHPQIGISNYNALKKALNSAPHTLEKIGVLKERLVIEFSNSNLEAFVTYNLPKDALNIKNREKLINETNVELNKAGVVFGITNDIFLGEIQSGKRYLIARGIPPMDGNDCIVKMYKLRESKPEINEDGTVDFYELKLINKVKAGDWLGERIEATKGIQGKSVKGEPLKAQDGKSYPLNYDRNTVVEISESNKLTLYSRINGAVSYIDDKILVSNHLEIDGDVDFRTGNIKFDGYITIKGTVTDGFHVEATKDIEINSQLGLGHVKGIVSTMGSIYIKGGISSKGQVEIRAAKNVYTKFIDNASIICGGTAHIGFYCINSTVNAKEVIMDSSNGKIIGGNITAVIRVVSPVIGSEIEKKTIIEVKGFSRDAIKEELDETINRAVLLKAEQQRLKQALVQFDGKGELNPFQRKEYNEGFERLINIKESIKELEEKRKDIAGYLKTHGEGEINITKKAYPNCTLRIKRTVMEITSVTMPTVFYYNDGEIKHT